MHMSDRAMAPARDVAGAPANARRGARALRRLTGGGADGNERLTTVTGIVLLALLLVIGVTIVQIGQLISVHLFVGLLLIGPVALKMASTGYRFARYYTRNAIYRRKGPPETGLRVIAPIVVLSTCAVFVSGVILMLQGRTHRHPMQLIHKVSFIAWVVFFGLHVLGHLPEVIAYIPGRGWSARARELREVRESLPGLQAPREQANHDQPKNLAGRGGRSLALAAALVAGMILAIALIPDYGSWTHHLADFGRGDH